MDVEFSHLGHGNRVLLGFKEAPTIDNFDHAYKSSTFTIRQQRRTGEHNFIRFLIVSEKGVDSKIKVQFTGKRKPPVYEVPVVKTKDPKEYALVIKKELELVSRDMDTDNPKVHLKKVETNIKTAFLYKPSHKAKMSHKRCKSYNIQLQKVMNRKQELLENKKKMTIQKLENFNINKERQKEAIVSMLKEGLVIVHKQQWMKMIVFYQILSKIKEMRTVII